MDFDQSSKLSIQNLLPCKLNTRSYQTKTNLREISVFFFSKLTAVISQLLHCHPIGNSVLFCFHSIHGMKSSINGKQKDRVASYAGGMLNRVNGGGSSAHAHDKKKPYRARGCRGGASRKARSSRKNPPMTHSRQNEENDPSRLNHNSYVEGADKHDTPSDGTKSSPCVFSDNPARTLSILPTGSELNVYQGTSGGITESTIEVDFLGQSQHVADSMSRQCEPKPIRPNVLHERAPTSTSKGAIVSSAIDRPPSNAVAGDGIDSGGFSFFCISPRSFLTGRKTRTQRPP